MKKTVKANLRWIGVAEGGQRVLPKPPKFVTVARFECQGEEWLKNAWSLVVEFSEMPEEGVSYIVNVSFLFDEGPEEYLQVGSKFELLGGSNKIAEGIIIP